jgi:hypothetical protein
MGDGFMGTRFIDLDTSWRWLVSFKPRPLYSRKSPRYTLIKRVSWPQSRSGRCGIEKNLLPQSRIEPWSSSPTFRTRAYALTGEIDELHARLASSNCLHVLISRGEISLEQVGSHCRQKPSKVQPSNVASALFLWYGDLIECISTACT